MAYDEMTGNFLGKYALPQGIISMARLSNGDVLALTSANTVVRFTSIKAKPSAGIPVEGCSAARYIAADSKDNVYIADSGRNIIIKCDKALKKTAEYGKDKLTGLKRVFIGPQDSIYAMDSLSPGKLTVKIFSADGVMKKQFNVLNNALLSGLEGLAVTPGGEVYMNSTGANSVLCYGPDGNLLGAIRSAAGNDTPFSYPPGIAGGMDGKFIVATYSMLVLQDIKY
jgi:hypothetical protein